MLARADQAASATDTDVKQVSIEKVKGVFLLEHHQYPLCHINWHRKNACY